jgi:hypothetical protein
LNPDLDGAFSLNPDQDSQRYCISSFIQSRSGSTKEQILKIAGIVHLRTGIAHLRAGIAHLKAGIAHLRAAIAHLRAAIAH